MVDVLLTICTVVGAVVLYCGVMAGLWALVLRGARKRARAKAAAREAAASLAVGDPRERRAQSWEELPGWAHIMARSQPCSAA